MNDRDEEYEQMMSDNAKAEAEAQAEEFDRFKKNHSGQAEANKSQG